MTESNLPVAIIGAGPVGLAAAAHLLERGETPIVFESGAEVGASVRAWGHVRMFSPWEYTVDSATSRLLQVSGWQMPPKDELPTGNDLVDRYMLPFANLPEVSQHIQLNARVVAVSRRNIDKMKDTGRDEAPFVLHVAYANGDEKLVEARAVIDASGTWSQPNPLGSGGLPAVGEKHLQERIAYGIPDVKNTEKLRYGNQRVLVVGSGHSAINVLLELAELKRTYPQTTITWAMRGTNLQRVFGGGENDGLPARASLGARMQKLVDNGMVEIVSPFRIRELVASTDGVSVIGETYDGDLVLTVDQIIATTGARPDLNMLRELRLDLDSSLESTRTLAPMIDPNIHSCGSVPPHGEAELRHPEKNFYMVGMKSYGRAPTFLLATGYEQVRSVVAGLVGDWEAARDVQLVLPETGVCSTDLAGEGGAACCSPAVSQSATLSLFDIPIKREPVANMPLQIRGGHLIALEPILLQTSAESCGCDDTCCADGVKSTTCGIDE